MGETRQRKRARLRRELPVRHRQLRRVRKRAKALASRIRKVRKALRRLTSDDHLWGGSRGVINEVTRIVAGRAPITSGKRAASDPLSIANPDSDHNEANRLADARDFGTANNHALKNEISRKLGGPATLPDYGTFTVRRNGHTYRVQIIAGTHGTGPHLHVGVRRA